jgi:hypothetical protein
MVEPNGLHGLLLHVFEQDGGWHWALTVERKSGTGKQVIAFSAPTFCSEAEARADGAAAYERTREKSAPRSVTA